MEAGRSPLLLLGCGYTLTRLVERGAIEGSVHASTRDAGRRALLEARGATVLDDPLALLRAHPGARVVLSVPPEAGLDAAFAAELEARRPERLVYLSSTGVYGRARGEVTEETPVEPEGAGSGRVRAEELYRRVGGVSLRVAGIYGPGRGLHERVRAGSYRVPGDGSGRISRIHVDDLCAAIEVALTAAPPGATYNVADDAPVPQREVLEWLSARLGVPYPPSVPLEEAPPTLRGDRAISNARLRALGWRPRYPTYREGFEAVLERG